MSEVITLNRYVCSFGTTKMNVDAPNMYTAVKHAVESKGVEPNTVILSDIGVSVVKASADVTYQAIVETIDGEVPGNVYPREGTCPVGNKVTFTAVPKDGYKFRAYTTISGSVLGTDPILVTEIKDVTQILAKFSSVRSDSTIATTTL